MQAAWVGVAALRYARAATPTQAACTIAVFVMVNKIKYRK